MRRIEPDLRENSRRPGQPQPACDACAEDTSNPRGAGLTAESVVGACDALSKRLNEAQYLPSLVASGMTETKAREELLTAKSVLSRAYIEKRMAHELGALPAGSFTPYGSGRYVRQEWRPLGVLLHIAAGNMDALPAFSVVEGLLTGNINILKLPGVDGALSIDILRELVEIEPAIADYVYVCDIPSEDTESMKKLAEISDAVVVWGGDAAVSAVRSMARPNTRIIEWGHKISFAYVSGEAPDEALKGIAYHICDTNQTLCSSCQGIFVDSESYSDAVGFAGRFIKLLDAQARAMPRSPNPYLDAQKTLELYTEELEAAKTEKKVFSTENCGVIAYNDSALTASYMYRHCWVKPLPQRRLLPELVKYKNHLQTAALVCEAHARGRLESMLLRTGIVRITDGGNMSQSYCGMPHDGEFSLRRYMKIVSFEY